MGSPIEAALANGMLGIVGDPLYTGLLVLGFFAGFVILQNTSLPLKVLIITGAAFLASAFIPFLGLITALATSALLYAGIMRVVNK